MLWRRRISEEIRVFVFSNDLMTSDAWGRQGLDYIALRVQRLPLDQTDLSNGLDVSSKMVGDRHTIGRPRRAKRPHMSGGGPPLR